MKPRPPRRSDAGARAPSPGTGAAGRQKRALTQQRRRVRVDRSGEPRAAELLERALDVGGGEEQARKLTHGFHSWPARMHPLTARRAIAALALPAGAVVLDPFCGSGTVLVEARRAGLTAWGLDSNPLAVLVARAKTWSAGPAARRDFVTRARRVSALAVEEGKAARRAGWEPPPDRAPPPGMTPAARDAALRGWFAPHVRRELETLARLVEGERDEALRPLMMAVLSSVIVKMSRRESDTKGEVVESRQLGRGMAARLFAARAEELVQGLAALDAEMTERTQRAERASGAAAEAAIDVREGDARRLPTPRASVAAIVTSPPYAGTYDYVDHHALRLTLLGLGTRDMAAAEIGARRSFGQTPDAVARGLAQWEADYGLVLAEMARVLVPGGRAVLLVGDSLAGRGKGAEAVYADAWLLELAPRAGLEIVAAASAQRDALGRAEEQAFKDRPKREHLVLLRKK